MHNNQKVGLIALSISIFIVVIWLVDYLAIFKSNEGIYIVEDFQIKTDTSSDEKMLEKTETTISPEELVSEHYTIEEVTSGLYVPWSIAYTSDTRMLVTERNGNIRVVQDDELLIDPLISFREVSSEAEEGLMGLDVDPDYDNNQFIYVCYAYKEGEELRDKVVKLIDNGDSAELVSTLIDDIPAAQFHAGCEVKFGPDEKLYITTGDAVQKELPQDLDSLAGKILRINSDGSIPDDNPFPGSPIYSFGHRNPQGIAWSEVTINGEVIDLMLSTEHGPSVFDGPAGGDEVNVIKPGANYGWPVVSHEDSEEGMEDPKIVFTPAVAPGSAMVYSGKMFPKYEGDLFFGGLRGEGLYRVIFDKANPETVLAFEKFPDVEFGRIREVTEAPDGSILFVTSNMDGRGEIRDGDDKIYRISTKK